MKIELWVSAALPKSLNSFQDFTALDYTYCGEIIDGDLQSFNHIRGVMELALKEVYPMGLGILKALASDEYAAGSFLLMCNDKKQYQISQVSPVVEDMAPPPTFRVKLLVQSEPIFNFVK